MALQYVNVNESDFSGGIDVRSAETQLEKSYSEDLLNIETIERRLRKRRGSQGKAGNIPVRVASFTHTTALTDNVCFTLPSSVDITLLRSSPLIVYGLDSVSGSTEFGLSSTARYYPGFTTTVRKTLTATAASPPFETLVIPGTEHALGTSNIYWGLAESLSTVSLANSTLFGVEETTLTEANQNVSVSYQNSTGADKKAIAYYLARDAQPGFVYLATTATTSASIPASTHGLNNHNIIVQVWDDAGATRTLVVPDSLTISAAGQVDVTFTAAPVGNYTIILTAADAGHFVSSSISGSGSGSLILHSPTGPFIFSSVYRVNGTSLEMVYPDSVTYDPASDTTTWAITNATGSPQTFEVFYEYGIVRNNQICVTGYTTVGSDYSDSRPQLTIWGLDHTEIYASSNARQGWATHLDSYRRSSEARLVTGLGGNIFSENTRDEVGSTYLLPASSPDLTHVVASNRVLGPAFWDTGATPARTRGYITATGASGHSVRVSSVAYNSGTGWTEYTLEVPAKAILDSTGAPTSLASVISTTADLEDWLTVEGMGYLSQDGTFRIKAVTDGVNQIVVAVENAAIVTSDYDDSDTGGQAGVFTDQVDFTVSVGYIPGDTLVSGAFGVNLVNILSVSAITIAAGGFLDSVSLGSGLSIPARRTSNVVPLRSVTDFLRGDMVSYSGISRLLRIKAVNPIDYIVVNTTGNGTTATVTLTTGNVDHLAEGQSVILMHSGIFTGTVRITSLLSDTQFEFSSPHLGTAVVGSLQGYNIELDEAITWNDTTDGSTTFTVPERWIPVEAPPSTGNLLPSTHISYLDVNSYEEQPFLRSTMVSNNLYLTNSNDEVLKFDGAALYRAGIFPWQPGVFAVQDTAAAAKISVNARRLAYTAIVAAEGKLTITAATSGTIPVGTSVRLSTTGSILTYTVRAYSDDGANFYLLVDRALDPSVTATGTIAEIVRYSYYFRLNAVDANNNIIASAVTGAQDHVLELTGDAASYIRLVGFPAWDNYDYARIDLQIYRTKANLSAPFYKVSTKTTTFNSNDGYLDFTDTASDDTLVDLDQTSTLQTGLGQGWQEPLRAKYVTAAGNSLVLGNITDYPQIDFQLDSTRTLANSDLAGDYFLFQRSSASSGSPVSDMQTVAMYQWIDVATSAAITSVTGTAGVGFAVVTTAPHSMTTGDWAYLFWNNIATAGNLLTYSGWWQVTVTGASSFTVNHSGATAGILAGVGNFKLLTAADPTNIPVPLGLDGNWGTLNGNSTFTAFTAMRRLSLAINATMRKVDTTIAGMAGFTPWLTARAGGEFKAGQMVVRQPRSDAAAPRVKPVFSGYDLFINDNRTTTGATTTAQTRVYPSRVIMSFENYPELFDSPTSILDSESKSAIDVNPADGQEITGIIPFFGEAAFGAAQQSAVVVVFKSNSIYLLDLNEKRNGRNPVQRIETEGLGCTAPFSIAVTRNGIIFANESGIYSLGRNLSITYIGKHMERNWLESANRDQLAIMQGHHYAIGRQYKLAVPVGTDTKTSQVYIYDHTVEGMQSEVYGILRQGAWTRFDSHSATGWANLDQDAYFSTSTGRVMSLRRTGDLTDYRDDDQAITSVITGRAMDFGNAGIRKSLDGFAAHYRVLATSENTSVSTSLDLRSEFHELDGFIIEKATPVDGISDFSPRKMRTIWHSVGRRKGVYFQVQITNTGKDETMELAGLDFKVAGLSDRGILMAAETRSITE